MRWYGGKWHVYGWPLQAYTNALCHVKLTLPPSFQAIRQWPDWWNKWVSCLLFQNNNCLQDNRNNVFYCFYIPCRWQVGEIIRASPVLLTHSLLQAIGLTKMCNSALWCLVTSLYRALLKFELQSGPLFGYPPEFSLFYSFPGRFEDSAISDADSKHCTEDSKPPVSVVTVLTKQNVTHCCWSASLCEQSLL